MRLLNPLQWKFQPRTIATLLTWALAPLMLGIFAVWQSLHSSAREAGLTDGQVSMLAENIFRTVLLYSLPALVVCIAAAWLFSWVVVQPLWRLRQAMDAVTRGDLSREPLRVQSRDEVGQITDSFNHMKESLRVIVGGMAQTAAELDRAGHRLEESAGHTATASRESMGHIQQVRATAASQAAKSADGARAVAELRDSSEQVANAAEAQARQVEQAAISVQQVAAAIEQVAAGAGVVSAAAGQTHAAAGAGGEAFHKVMASMDRTRERVLQGAEELETLRSSLMHVDEILGLITEIADQTDLLALNAAIEAARVGEHGRGFAVVAGEVRRLSDRSRKAAASISDQLEQLRAGAGSVVATMEASTQEVQAGAVLAQEAGAAMERILSAVAQTQQQVSEISAAAEEISAASTQVVQVTHSLSAIAEENSATAEEMLGTVRSVAGLVAEVEDGARTNESSTVAMAASAAQVQGAAEQTNASADLVRQTASTLREHVARFRL